MNIRDMMSGDSRRRCYRLHPAMLPIAAGAAANLGQCCCEGITAMLPAAGGGVANIGTDLPYMMVFFLYVMSPLFFMFPLPLKPNSKPKIGLPGSTSISNRHHINTETYERKEDQLAMSFIM